MSSVIRWSPVSDLMSLHSAMDRLFGDTFGVPGQSRTLGAVGEGYLPLDIYQTDKDWVIRAAVPGIDPSAVEVTFDGGQITIKGEIAPPTAVKPEDELQVEVEIVDLRESRSKPSHGIVRIRNVTTNQRGEIVQTMFASALVLRKKK